MTYAARPVAAVLAALLGLQGCTRFQVQTARPVATAPASVELRVFETDADRSEGDVFDGDVAIELWRQHGDHWELVSRGNAKALADLSLPAGTWKMVVTGVERDGQMVPPPGRQEHKFTVAEGQAARLDLTVRSVPWEALIVVTVVVVAAVVVTAVVVSSATGGNGNSNVLSGLGGLTPGGSAGPGYVPGQHVPAVYVSPGPLVDLLLPNPDLVNLVVDVTVAVPVDLPPECGRAPHAQIVPAAHPGDPVVVHFDTRLDPDSFGPDTLTLIGPAGPVPFGVYSPDRGASAVLHPLKPLAPGTWQLTVDSAAMHTRSGCVAGRGIAARFPVAAEG